MSILSSLFEKIQKEKEQKQSAKSKLMDFEKMIADQARSQGMLPRTYLEQLCQQSESFANSKLVKVLLGERDVPTQKGRDAKPEVLTKRAMNVVKKGIKHSANKQRRRDDKDAVDESGILYRAGVKKYGKAGMKAIQSAAAKGASHQEIGKIKDKHLKDDVEQDTQYAKMIIQQNPQEYKKFMQTGDLMDAPTIYEKLFAYFSSSDADDMMPYGTQKARDGDPYVWLTDKLDDLGLTEGNEFAQKVRQMKAAGAKKGTKFKTSDGEEHTLEQILTQTRQLMDMLERKIQEQSAVEEDKTDKEIDDFHRELDQLVHKHFGHSSDEKREKVKEDAITEEEFDEAAGKKDACYHKVKARYKVWPSAYASGALVQCRKKGAANWGNKSD